MGLYLEAHEERLSLHVGKGHVEVANIPVLMVKVAWPIQLHMTDLQHIAAEPMHWLCGESLPRS